MSRIYLASSWRNVSHASYRALIRSWGHEVYDFTDRGAILGPGMHQCLGFEWSQIGVAEDATTSNYIRQLVTQPQAAAGYLSDLRHMEWADTCVMLLPCGRSAHLEAGYMKGRGKRVIIVFQGEKLETPELMYLLADHLVVDHEPLKLVLGDNNA